MNTNERLTDDALAAIIEVCEGACWQGGHDRLWTGTDEGQQLEHFTPFDVLAMGYELRARRAAEAAHAPQDADAARLGALAVAAREYIIAERNYEHLEMNGRVKVPDAVRLATARTALLNLIGMGNPNIGTDTEDTNA